MKKTNLIMACMGAVLLLAGCKNDKGKTLPATRVLTGETASAGDSTIYGVCGEGTAMHTLELRGDDGKLHSFIINPDDSIPPVFGGLLAGDRMAVIANVVYGDTMAVKVLNLTTLQGRWVSIDKNFEIKEGGVIESHMEAEANPWTTWKIYNGQLVLNRDTFDVVGLGADSLMLDNGSGIFGYKRVK